MIAQLYNALNVWLGTDYQKLLYLREKHKGWEKAWEKSGCPIDARKEWDKLRKLDLRLILLEDKEYPPLLREVPLAPFGIYVKGNLPPLSQPLVSIVGTRRASAAGQALARQLGRELAEQKIGVVSGLALGIDQAAHWGTLEGDGKTIAVLANGLEQVYPRGHFGLAKKILEGGGVLLSEYPVETPSYPTNFLARNRIVSGLSRGVVVIEAPLESGALVTARHAVEQNREVMVVPGPVNHPNYAGSHRLIKMGAALVTGIDDILESLSLPRNNRAISELPLLDGPQLKIVEAIKNAGAALSVDKLAELTKLEIPILNQSLSLLLIKDIIKENSGGKYNL